MGALSHDSHLEMTVFSDKLLFVLLGLITSTVLFGKINSQPSAVSELWASLNSARAVEMSGYLFSGPYFFHYEFCFSIVFSNYELLSRKLGIKELLKNEKNQSRIVEEMGDGTNNDIFKDKQW